jgi:uridine phosphorylase
MLRDLTKSDWQGLLNISDDRVPTAVILRGTRALKDQYARMRGLFSDVLDIRDPNVVVDDVLLGRLDGIPVAYASVYGAPMASEIVHLFGVLGTRLVVQIGCCGSLTDQLLAGDLFAASSAYCGEGASQYYKENGKDVTATFAVAEHFGMDRASLLYVYDCPGQGEHILEGDTDKNHRRHQGNQRMIRLALETVKDYARGEVPHVGRTS